METNPNNTITKFMGKKLTQEEKELLISELGAKDAKDAAKQLMEANTATFSLAKQLDEGIRLPKEMQTKFADKTTGEKVLTILRYGAVAGVGAYLGIKTNSFLEKRKNAKMAQMKLKQ